MKIDRKKLLGFLTIGATVAFSLSLVAIPSDTLTHFIGTDNAYLFMYFIAFVGSITTFASIPYPLFLLGLAAGGADPLWIGLTSAAGVITADTLTFFAARSGRALLSEKLQASMQAVVASLERHPKWFTPGLIAYGTLSPLSNDFAVITLSLMHYSFKRVVLPLAIGNVLYNVSIAYLGVYAYDWIVGLF